MNTPFTSAKHVRVLAEIKRRNLKIEQSIGSVRVYGAGVDIRATRLDDISLNELQPRR